MVRDNQGSHQNVHVHSDISLQSDTPRQPSLVSSRPKSTDSIPDRQNTKKRKEISPLEGNKKAASSKPMNWFTKASKKFSKRAKTNDPNDTHD